MFNGQGIDFCFRKGGTGKTTVTVNLGTCLAQLGKETYIMDAHIRNGESRTRYSGLEDVPTTLHEVLAGKANIKDANTTAGPEGG